MHGVLCQKYYFCFNAQIQAEEEKLLNRQRRDKKEMFRLLGQMKKKKKFWGDTSSRDARRCRRWWFADHSLIVATANRWKEERSALPCLFAHVWWVVSPKFGRSCAEGKDNCDLYTLLRDIDITVIVSAKTVTDISWKLLVSLWIFLFVVWAESLHLLH